MAWWTGPNGTQNATFVNMLHYAAKTEDTNAGIVGVLYEFKGLAATFLIKFNSSIYKNTKVIGRTKHFGLWNTCDSLLDKNDNTLHVDPPYLKCLFLFFKKWFWNTTLQKLAPMVEQKLGRQTIYHISHCMHKTHPSCIIVHLHLEYWNKTDASLFLNHHDIQFQPWYKTVSKKCHA